MTPTSNSHRVSFEAIRVAAIECHALDLSAHKLFVSGIHQPSRSTRIAYEELVTAKLLFLAIAIRTKFYQGLDSKETEQYVVECGFLDRTQNQTREARSPSIKDICDKIIHADSISGVLMDESNGRLTVIGGRGTNKLLWDLHLSISQFCEAVLNWLDDVD